MAASRHVPDLSDPRYLDEVGWFLCHEEFHYEEGGVTYAEQRIINARIQLDEFLTAVGHDEDWLADKSALSIGAGCTGDLAAWPCRYKVAADPLMIVYQRLGMLIKDACGGRTQFIAAPAEALPLLDAHVDIVYCRNALNHMAEPAAALDEVARVLKPGGMLFVDVDLDGTPTPDEPVVFTPESLQRIVGHQFDVVRWRDRDRPHSRHSPRRCELLAIHRQDYRAAHFDRRALLRAYLKHCRELGVAPDSGRSVPTEAAGAQKTDR